MRRPAGALLPGGGKRGPPGIAARKTPGVVGAREPAAAEPAHGDILADAQQHDVHDAVAVDIERIGAADLVQFETALLGHELERSAMRAGVAIELRRLLAAGQQQLRVAVVIAVEGRRAAADHVFPLALVDAVDAGAGGFLDKGRDGWRRDCRRNLFGRRGGKSGAAKRDGQSERCEAHGHFLVLSALAYWPMQRPCARPSTIADWKWMPP